MVQTLPHAASTRRLQRLPRTPDLPAGRDDIDECWLIVYRCGSPKLALMLRFPVASSASHVAVPAGLCTGVRPVGVLVGRQLYGAAADQVVIALRIGGSRRRDDMEEAKARPASADMF
jgi:hypothetical protein